MVSYFPHRQLVASLLLFSVQAESDKCTLHLAPSTIPNAGLGIFTSVPRTKGDNIGYGDVTLPFVDMNFHNMWSGFFSIFDEYMWSGEAMGMHRESDSYSVDVYAPGLDCAINCHMALLNVDRGLPQFDDAGLHRSRDPGAGAISLWHNGSTFAIDDIPAGGELFKYYGNAWFTSRQAEFGLIPLTNDWEKANKLLKSFHKLTNKLSQEVQQDIYSIIANFGYNGRVLNAFPSYSDVEQALAGGIQSLHRTKSVRSDIQKLDEARCLDSIKAGPSSIPQAGRGAFATRAFAKGQVVTGSPLLHVPNRTILDRYSHHFDEEFNRYTRTHVVSQQLVVNYCWGHHESSMLLCPYSAGVNYINHNQSQANLKLQWAPDGHIAQNDKWLKSPPEQFMYNYSPNLAWDYVAIRDIKAGEEFFIDYGDAWEDMWLNFVDNWEGVQYDDYAPAIEWNQRMEGLDLRTHEEQKVAPYPDNLEIRCHESILHLVSQNLQNDEDFWELWTLDSEGLPCKILERSDEGGKTIYKVEIGVGNSNIPHSNVDRKMMAFRDQPYSTDINLPNAFRQEAFIPDDMVPRIWRNFVDQHGMEL